MISNAAWALRERAGASAGLGNMNIACSIFSNEGMETEKYLVRGEE